MHFELTTNTPVLTIIASAAAVKNGLDSSPVVGRVLTFCLSSFLTTGLTTGFVSLVFLISKAIGVAGVNGTKGISAFSFSGSTRASPGISVTISVTVNVLVASS